MNDTIALSNRMKIKHIKNDNVSDGSIDIEPFLHISSDEDDIDFYNIIMTDGIAYKYQKFNSDDEELRRSYRACLEQLYLQRNECMVYIKELLSINNHDLSKMINDDPDNKFSHMYAYNLSYLTSMGVQITYDELSNVQLMLLASFVDVLNLVNMLIIDASTC